MKPYFSIVIPTYNRPAQLVKCLDALTRLDFPRHKYEVIAVNDGGKSPHEIIAPYQSQLNLQLITQAHAGPAFARNTGAQHARGDYLIFTDDDCAPHRDWLKAFAARFAHTPEHMIGGRTLNALTDNSFAAASQMLIDYLYDYYNSAAGAAVFFTSNNMAMSANRFRSIGGFDASFPLAAGEDRELCDRWRHHGLSMSYAPEALIDHFHNLSWNSFCRQHFNYGRSAKHFHHARAVRGNHKIKVEPPSFYANLLGYPLSHARGAHRKLILLSLFGVSQAANTCGFFYERIR